MDTASTSPPVDSMNVHGMAPAAVFKTARRIVVKVGSSLVTNEGRGLDEEAIGQWSQQLAALVQQGREVIMVSSGAVAEGMNAWAGPCGPRRSTNFKLRRP